MISDTSFFVIASPDLSGRSNLADSSSATQNDKKEATQNDKKEGARNDTPLCHCEERDSSLMLRNRLRNLQHEIVKEGIPSHLD